MPNNKVQPLDKKVPVTFSITKREIIVFRQKMKELGLNKSRIVDGLIKEFNRST